MRRAAVLALLAATVAAPQTLDGERNILVKLRVPVGSNAARGATVTAWIFSPEMFLGAMLEGAVVEATGGANARVRVEFRTIRHEGKEIPVDSALIGFVNSKGHHGVDDADRPTRVDGGALVAAALELLLDEGAELRLRVSPRR
jgi:hypothetical protein